MQETTVMVLIAIGCGLCFVAAIGAAAAMAIKMVPVCVYPFRLLLAVIQRRQGDKET